MSKLGEINYNKYGSKMIISKYNGCMDIDVYFQEHNFIRKNVRYEHFKRGVMSCPYDKSVFENGYIGEGKYIISKNGIHEQSYKIWKSMIQRVYDEKYKLKKPTYKNCSICDDWHCYQTFCEWFYENYYTLNNEVVSLDKDILFKGNKFYSPETCVFVPQGINSMFTKSNSKRGDYPIGVRCRNERYVSVCDVDGKPNHIGTYDTVEQAFLVYKEFKENEIKRKANIYKDIIPEKLYNAMYDYKVEITD